MYGAHCAKSSAFLSDLLPVITFSAVLTLSSDSVSPAPNVEDDGRDGDPILRRHDWQDPAHCARINPDCSPLCSLVSVSSWREGA